MFFSRTGSDRIRALQLALIISLVVLIATAAATLLARRDAFETDRQRFETTADSMQSTIERRLETYINMLTTLAGIFSLREEISFHDFYSLAEGIGIERRYPGIQGIGFAKPVSAGQAADVTRFMTLQEEERFAIHPAPFREMMFPIVYLHPRDERNKAAIGYDMFSEEVRRAAMSRARDTGEPSMSGRVSLVQEMDDGKQAGFLIYVPVYSGGKVPVEVPERRREIQGFVYSPFRADDFISGIFGPLERRAVGLKVYDGGQERPSFELHNTAKIRDLPERYNPRLSSSRAITVAGRSWSLQFFTLPEFAEQSNAELAWSVFAAGILSALALGIAAFTRSRARMESIESRRELAKSEERYRSFIKQSSEGIWRGELETPVDVTWDEQQQIAAIINSAYIAECNDAMARMYGYVNAEQLTGIRVKELFVNESPINEEFLRTFVRSNYRVTEVESHEVDRDGNHKVFTNSIIGVVEEGRLVRGWGIQRDLTAWKDAQEELNESKQRLQSIIELSADAIVTKDLNGIILSWNKAAERIFGYSAEEAVGRAITLIIPEERHHEEELILSKIRSGRKVSQFETERRRKDGTLINISVSSSPFTDPDGKIIGATKIARDITVQKKIDAALRESEQRFRMLADSAPVMIWMSDENKGGIYFNHRWLEFTGRTLSEESGEGWIRSVHPDDLALFRECWQAFDERRPFTLSYRLRRFDGRYRYVQDTGIPRFNEKGEFEGFVGSCIDVTEIKNAEESERAAREQAERAGRMKDEFLATLSHELRTPLNAILGWSQLVKRYAASPENLIQGLEVIERNARNQAKLIDDLLDMNRIISGKVKFDITQIDLRSLIDDAIQTVAPAADAKEIKIECEYSSELPVIRGDQSRMQQVLWNLLANGVKFNHRGGLVRVVVRSFGDYIEIAITDTGQGIEPEFLPRVFDRFTQADASSTRQHGGLGLGLAIVRHLVELHGGSVSASSPGKGRGSTFLIILPTFRVASPAIEAMAAVKPANPVRKVARQAAHRDLNGVRVLIIDDQPDSLSLLRFYLTSAKADVYSADNASDGLEIMRTTLPDIIISDIAMPEMDGYDFMRAIRKLPPSEGGATPGIALTAFAREEDRFLSLRAGYQMHLTKPIAEDELIAAVHEVLASARRDPAQLLGRRAQ
ncbi:MAG: PAS domain S-box protein [Deltaproteobacteria bacterium]|nr:PAS domain S-box protein [Deltaproteobacteria bacterium]